MKNLDFSIPENIYTSDLACGEFIIALNERLAEIANEEKQLKAMKEEATNVMLTRLAATGQKHFAFDFGTFYKNSSIKYSFPTAEDGGKEKAVQWLCEAVKKGIISVEQLLDVQQSRLVAEPLLAIEKAVEEYNRQMRLNGNENQLMEESPFNHYEHISLVTPRKRRTA